MKTNFDLLNDLFIYTNEILGLDGINIRKDMEIDENDVNIALDLINNKNIGKGNHYNNELNMAMYLYNVEKLTSSKYDSAKFISYVNFLTIDGLAKYILCRARQNGDLDKNFSLIYGEKLRNLNEYVRTYGPMDTLEDCMETYFEICHMILGIVGIQKYGFAC